ncbi:MAG: TonB-dependent copper receptor, partial [Comamonas sp.]|nr:TonB-dependent copper receptor [Comamonas sp.]
ESYYLRLTANHSQSKDYKDGSGRIVPSHWDKWNTDVALGFTPDAQTLIELSAGTGDGEARYGGRGMDGTRFRRESAGLRFEKSAISPLLSKLEAQLYYNQADHVMDNFSLRPFKPSGHMSMPMASNVRRTTTGLRAAATWELTPATSLLTGMDAMNSPHDKRSGSAMQPYGSKPWMRDARFSNLGLFAELNRQLDLENKLVAGLRLDRAQAWRYPDASSSMGGMSMAAGNAAASNQRERSALPSGFVRWERELAAGSTVYAGLGHVQRFPDYWELISPGNSSASSGNAFASLKPEKTTQIDVGASWKAQDWQAWTSAYLGYVQDYMLFDYRGGMSSQVRNVNARTAGIELGGSYRLTPALTAQATLAYSWARNATDQRPLPQTPPLEAKLGLDYHQGAWSAGALWRVVAAQHRFAAGQGNVVGKDFGPSAGFGLLSVNAGYSVHRKLKLTAGIDNLFDKNYAEHLNLAGNAGFGLPGGQRINEPGRTLWVRADFKY